MENARDIVFRPGPEMPEGLELTFNGECPSLLCKKMNFSPKGFEYLELKYIAEGGLKGNSGNLLFGTKTVPNFNDNAKFYMPAIVADGREHTAYVMLFYGRGQEAWKSAEAVTSMRLELASRFTGRLLVKSIRLLSRDGVRASLKWPPADSKEWVLNGTNAGWDKTRNLTATETPDGLVLDLTGPHSNIEIRDIEIAPHGADFMQIDYVATGIPASTNGQLYFATDTAPALSESAKYAVGSLKGDGQPHTLFINLHNGKAGELWEKAKSITRLRLDLVNQFPGKIRITAIRLVDGELYWKDLEKKYAPLGIPVRIPSEIPEKPAETSKVVLDSNAPQFASPMTSPAGGSKYQGINYLRTDFTLEAIPDLNLLQTVCDDKVEAIYLNGHKLDHKWSSYWRNEDSVEIPRELFRIGKNALCMAYENASGIGGLMLDLQMVLPNGRHLVVTPAEGIGSTEKPDQDWTTPEYECKWPKVETRPGPPASPWTNAIPRYISIKTLNGKVEITGRVIKECEVEVTFRGTPPLSETERIYGNYTTANGTLVCSLSGTIQELDGALNPDGCVTIRFSPYKMTLYGPAHQGCWSFGVYERSASGQKVLEVASPERAVPGENAVLKLSRTATGPVPMLNGNPFYFNILTSHQYKHQFTVSSGMEGKGSPFNVVAVRAGGASETDWWKGPDQYDFSGVDRMLSQLMELYPDSMLGVYVWCHPANWYEKLYPERISRADDGSKVGYYVSTVTFSDPDVRADAQRALTAFVTHCEKYFGSRIVLYNLMGGISCEWQGWECHSTTKYADFGINAKRDFINYAAARGVKVEEVPGAEARMASDGGIFRNPKRDAIAMLYDEYYNESVAECIRCIAEAVKKACGGNKLVGCYYGYFLEYANIGQCVNGGGHNALGLLLNSPDLDFFLSPNSYGIRPLGMPNGEGKPFAAIREAGKLSMLEDDTRTHLTPPAGCNQTITLEHTLNILKRNVGMYLAHRMPLNQLPLVGGNELDDPRIRDLFAKSVKAGQYLMEQGLDPTTEIAAVIDADSVKYLASTRAKHGMECDGVYCYNYKGELTELGRSVLTLYGELLYYQREALGQIGAPVDILLLSDVKRVASKYKMFIFLNAFADSKELEEAFAALRMHNAAAVITYGAGFIDANGFSAAAMSRLAGMTIANTQPGWLKLKWDDQRTFGSEYEVNPRFAVEDASAKAFGRYADNEAVAVAEKGNVLFYGAASLDTEFIREYARGKGIHIYCDTRENLCAGGSIVSINARSAGRKSIHLPRKCRVEDIYSGEVIVENAKEISLEMKAFETRVFLCK